MYIIIGHIPWLIHACTVSNSIDYIAIYFLVRHVSALIVMSCKVIIYFIEDNETHVQKLILEVRNGMKKELTIIEFVIVEVNSRLNVLESGECHG